MSWGGLTHLQGTQEPLTPVILEGTPLLGIKFSKGWWSTLPLPQTFGYFGLILTSPAAPPPPGGCAQESRGPRSAPGDLHSGEPAALFRGPAPRSRPKPRAAESPPPYAAARGAPTSGPRALCGTTADRTEGGGRRLRLQGLGVSHNALFRRRKQGGDRISAGSAHLLVATTAPRSGRDFWGPQTQFHF